MSKISNKFLAQAPTKTLKGNNTAGTANVTDLTVAQIISMLAIDVSNITYTPSNPSYWGPTPPTTLQEALDQIATQTGMLGPD